MLELGFLNCNVDVTFVMPKVARKLYAKSCHKIDFVVYFVHILLIANRVKNQDFILRCSFLHSNCLFEYSSEALEIRLLDLIIFGQDSTLYRELIKIKRHYQCFPFFYKKEMSVY